MPSVSIKWIRQALKSGPGLNLAAGYFSFVSAAIYGFASIPVAVHFLAKEEIGLWNLISQVVAYLLFLELGVGAAAGRMLAEPLSSGNQGQIDRSWSTILAILASQSAIILAVGWMVSPALVSFFSIPPHLADDARFLWLGMSFLHAAGFPLRAYTGVLLCQERYHWSLIINGLVPWIQLATFATLLAFGAGLRAYVAAFFLVSICQFVWLRWLVGKGPHRLRFQQRSIHWPTAKPILGYSFSMMMWALAPAIIASIPAVILGRFMGLEYVTVYIVTFRVPQMVSMLALRGFHAFFPKMQNLYVIGQRTRFAHFYRVATSLSLLMTGLGLVIAMLANRHVVEFLARSDFYAGNSVTLWFALGFITMAVSEHLGSLFIIAGKGKLVSLILGVEMIATFFLASLLCQRFGLTGVAASLALGPLLVRTPYYLFYGPRTCLFSIKDLYQNAWLALVTSILCVAGTYFLMGSEGHPTQGAVGLTIVLLAILPATYCCRRILADVHRIRMPSMA